MIFDFHAHAYEPGLARVVRERFHHGGWSKNLSRPDADAPLRLPLEGTVGSLLAAMDDAGISRSALLPVAIRPGTAPGLNDWAIDAAQRDSRLVPFATIHPGDPDWASELDRVVAAGVRGVKIHPQLQTSRDSDCLLDEGYLQIFQACERQNVPVVTCTYFPREVRARSGALGEHLRSLLGMFPRLVLVAAHMGAMFNWRANQAVVGTGVYLDLAYVPGQLDDDELVGRIRAHGPDRVLFGSDAPYAHPKAVLDGVLQLGLHDDELEAILGGNAERILGTGPAPAVTSQSRSSEGGASPHD